MSKLYLKPNPTLADLQQYMAIMMQERGFTNQSVMQTCMLLTEEIGELIKCVRKSHTGLRVDASKRYELDPAGEIADILVVLTCIANQLGINMEQALRNKEEKNKQRDWR